jgi:PKD repeat protein
MVTDNGNKFVKMHHNGTGDWCSLFQEVRSKLVIGKTYKLTCSYKTLDNARAHLSFGDVSSIMHSNGIASNNAPGEIKDGNWHTLEVIFTATEDNPRPDRPNFVVYFDYGYAGDIYIDDLSLVEYSETTPEPASTKTTVITMDISNFDNISVSPRTQVVNTSEGVKLYGAGYRADGRLQTKQTFNLIGSTVYYKFKTYTLNNYAAFTPFYGPSQVFFGEEMTTNHSWMGSLVIPDNTWIYIRAKLNDDYSFERVISTGNYDDRNGVVLYQESGVLSEERINYINNSNKLGFSFGDNYYADTSVIIGGIEIVEKDIQVTPPTPVPTNSPPILASLDNKTVNEGELLQFGITAADPDGDELTFASTSDLPTGAEFNQTTGIFSWTPDYTQAGTYQVTFTVSDGNLTDSKTASITVNNVNRAPVLETIGDRTIDEGKLIQFTLNASDPDGDTLAYSAGSLPNNSNFDPSTRTFSWTPDYTQAGTYQVSFTVSDGNLVDTKQITITVSNVEPTQLTSNLINIIENNDITPESKNSLTSKLNNAIEILEKDQKNAAINKLNATINEIKAKQGKQLTNEQAEQLIMNINTIIYVISL